MLIKHARVSACKETGLLLAPEVTAEHSAGPFLCAGPHCGTEKFPVCFWGAFPRSAPMAQHSEQELRAHGGCHREGSGL